MREDNRSSDKGPVMKVIAHRGACTEALENSWAAFNLAVEAGAQRIELDIHLTADGQLAIVHDEDLKRTAGIDRRIKEMSRSDIERSILLSNGEKLPFLDEVLAKLLPVIEFNVEIKTPGPAIVDALTKLMQNYTGDADRIIVSSFHEETCKLLAQDYPWIHTALLWDRKLWWPGAFHWGPRCFMDKYQIRIFHPDAKLVTPKMVASIKQRGWEIYPYVGLRAETEKEKLWSYLMTLGVDGLCTNYPRQMHLWLQEAKDDEERFRDISVLVNSSP